MALPISSSATITMTVHDYRAIEAQYEQLCKLLQEHAAAAPAPTADESLYRAALEAALPVVHFAIANLPPETYAGWPHGSLRGLGKLLLQIYPDDRAREPIALDFQHFADEAAAAESFRARRYEAARAQLEAAKHEDTLTGTIQSSVSGTVQLHDGDT